MANNELLLGGNGSPLTEFQARCVAEHLLRRLQMHIQKVVMVQYFNTLNGQPPSFVEILFLNGQGQQISYSLHIQAWQKAAEQFSPIELN